MLIRRCSAGHDIQLHMNNRQNQFVRDNNVTKKYFVLHNGSMDYQTNSFKVAEEKYLAACKKEHSASEKIHGKLRLGHNALKKGVVVDLKPLLTEL